MTLQEIQRCLNTFCSHCRYIHISQCIKLNKRKKGKFQRGINGRGRWQLLENSRESQRPWTCNNPCCVHCVDPLMVRWPERIICRRTEWTIRNCLTIRDFYSEMLHEHGSILSLTCLLSRDFEREKWSFQLVLLFRLFAPRFYILITLKMLWLAMTCQCTCHSQKVTCI